MADLGEQLERYDANNRRRALRGVLAILVGTPVLAFGAFSLLIVDPGRAGASMFIVGIMLGGGLGAVIMGTILAVQSITRHGEHFVLHEHGLVHAWADRTTVVPWTDVADVTDIGRGTLLAKAFGGDVGCQIKLTDGRRVTINSYTDGAPLLIHRVLEATAAD
ncbi:hypothetical protein ACFWNN_40760 [Lentzea sp. NPDC058450]|uniref:hypothetical protein n=1 Tax=Lentzea sp. NPDC058450 TaxID=3346505 RepID=UPI003646FC01